MKNRNHTTNKAIIKDAMTKPKPKPKGRWATALSNAMQRPFEPYEKWEKPK